MVQRNLLVYIYCNSMCPSCVEPFCFSPGVHRTRCRCYCIIVTSKPLSNNLGLGLGRRRKSWHVAAWHVFTSTTSRRVSCMLHTAPCSAPLTGHRQAGDSLSESYSIGRQKRRGDDPHRHGIPHTRRTTQHMQHAQTTHTHTLDATHRIVRIAKNMPYIPPILRDEGHTNIYAHT